MKLFKKCLLVFAAAFIGFSIAEPTLVAPSIVHAGDLFGGTEISGTTSQKQASSITKKIRDAAKVLAAIVLSISIIMIIVGGLRYILSNGDPKQAEQGKMILLYSGLGIVIALSAITIANFFGTFKV